MRHPGLALAIGLLALAMLAGLLQLPPPGAPDSPAQVNVSADYIAAGDEAVGASNLVTAVLLNWRGLDTFIEVMVIFSALIAVLSVLGAAPTSHRKASDRDDAEHGEPARSPVTAYVVRLLAPFMAAFAAFVMISGDELPGGGFQGCVVLGAMIILLTVAMGRDRVVHMLPIGPAFWFRAAAPLTFALVAVTGLVATGWWFGLAVAEPFRHALMLALEIAIGVGGAAVLAGIFLALSRR